MPSHTTHNTPALRFPGYTGVWERRKVSDISDRYDNLRIPVAANLRMKGSTPYYGANGIQDYVDGYTHDGEFILVAEDGANDLKNYPINYVNGRIWVNNHAHVLQAKEILADNRFLSYAMGRADIESVVVGGGRAKLNAEALMNISLHIPSLSEQQKIGSFFHHLDGLINLHQRQTQKLTELKQGLLQNMFPQEGESVPRLRFPGFTTTWKQHKLSDVASITMGQSPDGSTYSTTPQGHILIQGNADLSHGWVSPRVWTTQVTKTCDAGDIIMSVRAPAGAIGRTQYNAVIGRGVAAIKGNDFIYQSLARMNDIGYWRSLVTGSTFESINSTDLKNADLCVPSLSEQRKIGSFFRTLDDLIHLHEQYTVKLTHLKKGLLQKMFPQD